MRRPLAVATARACAARLDRVRALHLTEQGEEDDGELGHRVVGVAGVDLDRVCEVPDPDAALSEVVDHVERIADGAAEAIEGVDDDHVALAGVADHGA
jgi:hypothetical protein